MSCKISNHYEILGVSRTSSKDEIRHAYKSLALQFHPDKNKTLDDSDKFAKIKEAYETLIDEDKRRCYDTQCKFGCDGDGGNGGDGDDLIALSCQAILLISKLYQFIQYSKDREKRNVTITVQVSLEEIWTQKVKHIIVKVKRFNVESRSLEYVNESYYIHLANFQNEHVFDYCGDDCVIPRFLPGDLTIILDIIPHPFLQLNTVLCPYDLYTEVNVPLVDYYTKSELVLYLFDNVPESKLCVQMSRLFKNQSTKSMSEIVTGFGLPYTDEMEEKQRGDLYIKANIILPEKTEILAFCKKIENEYCSF